MKIKLNILLALLLVPFLLFAQDFHLTQFDAASQYFNPALTGMYLGQDANYRIYSDYRTQWRAIGVKPFATYYLGYDMPYKDYGLGGYLIHNSNGPGGLNTLNFMPSAAYKITKDEKSPHYLTVGAQMGILYRSYDPNSFTYDNQFSPDVAGGFNTNISNGENFSKAHLLKFNASMGAFYKLNKEEWQAHPWIGYAVYNMPRPNMSLTGVEKDKLPMRWVIETGADYKINEAVTLKPMLLYMYQGAAHEFNIGSKCFYKIGDTKYDVTGGLFYRAKDAFIIQAGMRYEQHIITFSYDINTSYLNNYTSGRGAFELSIILSGFYGRPLLNPKFFGGKGPMKSL
ncbi:MAG TPA: PorP/SprF family type IX secretion system membrane protein [Bacteroidia bacterium]